MLVARRDPLVRWLTLLAIAAALVGVAAGLWALVTYEDDGADRDLTLAELVERPDVYFGREITVAGRVRDVERGSFLIGPAAGTRVLRVLAERGEELPGVEVGRRVEVHGLLRPPRVGGRPKVAGALFASKVLRFDRAAPRR